MMIKKSIKIEIDTKEASLTQKEASAQSPGKGEYCSACEKFISESELLPKMGGMICPYCRKVLAPFRKVSS